MYGSKILIGITNKIVCHSESRTFSNLVHLASKLGAWAVMWLVKSHQLPIKVAQKWFHLKMKDFLHLYKYCLKCGQFGQNKCCHRLWKVVQSAINRPIRSNWTWVQNKANRNYSCFCTFHVCLSFEQNSSSRKLGGPNFDWRTKSSRGRLRGRGANLLDAHEDSKKLWRKNGLKIGTLFSKETWSERKDQKLLQIG